MARIVVGEIQGYDVLYIPERDCLFCKNTVLPVSIAKEALKSSLDRYEVPDKNLVILLSNFTIDLGCLSTTRENCRNIIKNINKLKDE